MLYAFGAILSCSLLASLKPSFSLTSLLIDQLCRLAHSWFGADAPGKIGFFGARAGAIVILTVLQ
jgi:hypothetical protein